MLVSRQVIIKFCIFLLVNDFLFAYNTASTIDALDVNMAGWSHHFLIIRPHLEVKQNAQI